MTDQQQPTGAFALQTRQQTRNEVEYVPFGGTEKIKLSVSIIMNLIAAPTRSGKLCSERDAMKFLMLCRSRALNPFEGDAYLVGYDSQDGPVFSLITAHQAFLKRAEPHPEFDGMESGVIISPALACPMCSANGGREVSGNWVTCSSCKGVGQTDEIEGDLIPEGHTLIGGWAKVHFKQRKVPTKRRLALRTFDSQRSRWKADPAGMIVKCAEADALRSSFPTKLGGLYLKEEQDIPVVTSERATDLGNAQVQQPTQRARITQPSATAPSSFDQPPMDVQSDAGQQTQQAEEPPAQVKETAPAKDKAPRKPKEPAATTQPAAATEKPKDELSPAAALEALITVSQIPNLTVAEVIAICVSKFKGPEVAKIADWPEDYIKDAIANFQHVEREIKTKRALS
jgi:phage recombination protein Bet